MRLKVQGSRLKVRRRVLVLLFGFLFLSSCTSFHAGKRFEALPESTIVFEEPVYDFGFAGPKQEITHTFSFYNANEHPVKIESVATDCGCTAALVSDEAVPPGEKGEVRTFFVTPRYEGKQEKHVTLRLEKADEPETTLTIKGIVKRDIAVMPQAIDFGNVGKSQQQSSHIRLLQLSNDQLLLEKVEANSDYFDVKSSWFQDENSRGYDVEITLKRNVPVGRLNDAITLHTNLKKRPRIDVVILANVLE